MVTLAEEEPFAAVVEVDYLTNVCSSCFKLKEDGVMSRCNKCRLVHYCSRKCQKKDWINHKMECPLLESWYPLKPPTMPRLVARIVLKLARSDAQVAAFNGRRYEDLMDHYEDIKKDPLQSQFFAHLANVVNAYLGPKYAPKREVLMSIYGKCITNSFSICMELKDIGSGLYIGLSAQNHSCNPDAHIVFEGSKAILRSPDETKKYSKDITVTYIDLLYPNQDRKERLRNTYYFNCTCSVCSDPERDFLYNSACSTCCPDNYCLLDPSASQLKCFKCGAPSKITVKQAIAANDEIRALCRELEDEKDSISDKAAHLQSLIKTHEKFSKILSPLNVNLLRVTNKLFDTALVLNDFRVCQKYVQNILPAYRRYLSVGHPALTYRLMYISYALTSAPTVAKNGLEIIEEALAASTASHGPNSPYISIINNMLLAYRMREIGLSA